MFNIKYFSLKIIYKSKPISDFQHMNSCDFKEIIIPKDLEIENSVLKLDRDCYLSIVKFLDSSTLRKV
jgi:hypothetical protein